LKVGLSFVLVFIGAKMLLDPHLPELTEEGTVHSALWFQVEIPTSVSLLVVGSVISVSILLSIVATRREAQLAAMAQRTSSHDLPPPPPPPGATP
jgi:predicted tellurium resistance membrane protein TerC